MMISQVISIGPFQPSDMILELPNEDQKRGENKREEQLFRHATGLDYQMYSSAFPEWVKIQHNIGYVVT